MKKLIILGCTGFIGKNVAEFFAREKKYKVYGTYFKSKPFKNKSITFLKADLTDKIQVNKVLQGKDILIQAAATTTGAKDIVSKPYIHVTDNAVINSYVMRSAFENKLKRVIFFSCSIMYKPSNKPQKEVDLNLNLDPFKSYFGAAWMKIFIEKTCEFFSRFKKTKFTVIRHTNIYGPNDKFDLNKSHVFGASITKVLNAKNEIIVWGKGEEKRDFLHVYDLIKFIKLSLKKQKSYFELINLSNGKSIRIKDLIKKIIKISKKKINIKYDISKPNIKTSISVNSDKARKLYGWRPEITIDKGIYNTLQWYSKNIRN